jgi:glyoxylase-like metal-dependent hydrolase (beta-lactamase superfamily II)
MPRKIAPEVYMVGGPDLSDPRDCLCYLVLGSQARVLIDCGAGPSAKLIMELVSGLTREPLTHLLLTHAHIDHVGGAAQIAGLTGCQVLIHADDAAVLASGDALRSAANWYGLSLEAVQADRLLADGDVLEAGPGLSLHIVHTPGHTPGSLCAWCESGGQRVLFGQDIHGPFSPAFGSDLGQWRLSMRRLLEIRADILAEGHYGVFRPAGEVESFIRQQLAQQG